MFSRNLAKRLTARRATNKTSLAKLETLEPRIVLDSTVVFNEIMFNPAGAEDAKMEFIELHNQLAVDMDISEWKLSGGVEFEFADGTVVPGRGQLVIASDPQALQEAAGITNVVGPWEGRLSNAGESIQLFNNDERLMNTIDFNDGGDWPSAPDGGGVSLTKLDQQTASHLAKNWTFSRTLGGTPGENNSPPTGQFERFDILAAGSPASAFVPTDDSLGLNWIQPEFDDASWLHGTTGIGFDSGRNEPYNEFLGLDLDAPPNGQEPMPMEDVNGSVYMRIPFTLNEPVDSWDRLQLLLRYEDGFVAYLNGTEWTSANAPGRDVDGELAWNSLSGRVAPTDADAVTQVGFDLLSNPELLRQGENMLAVQGLNRRLSDNDLLFEPTIIGLREIVQESTESPIKFNEVGAAGEGFFVEIVNTGVEEQTLEGFTFAAIGENPAEYAVPTTTLQAGERLAFDNSQLSFTVADGEQIHLYANDKQKVIDARKVSDRIEGVEETTGTWQFPSSPSPGAANVFDTESDIVINEIMYHMPETPGEFEIPPTFERTEFFPLDWPTWKYNQAGIDLGPEWHQTEYAVDDQQWFLGAAPLGVARNELDPPANTPLVVPRDNDPRFNVHYFQTEFELTEEQLSKADIIEMTHFVDDGAVIFLNGQEIRRINLPGGELDFETRATIVAAPTVIGPVIVDRDAFQVGKNVLSVQLHQDSNRSRDIAMALSFSVGEQVTDVIPGVLAQENPEEWIELYNRGTEPVDLTGWRLRDGVRFNFPDETVIGPGEYLVIANDDIALQAKYPDANIVGNFSGSLSDRDDRLRLYDTHDNLADDVHYYEGGSWPELADGGGVSLELMNPFADNSKGESWTISDNSDESEWITHTRRGIADIDVTGTGVAFHEFVFGMLRGGEILIDDISVIQDPAGEAISVLQNGTFESDTLGASPEKWRIIGNHSGNVIADPDNPNNKVLHLTATGAQAHIHDHAETTFADEREIILGEEYEISFRAKWLRGNSQLHSRLFYNRIPDTTALPVPELLGTPGSQNTGFVENTGPTYSGLSHDIATPKAGQSVTVSIDADDPDGVESVNLMWREDGGEWNQAAMAANALGTYEASIPGHSSGAIVQFYVEATDSKGMSSTFPTEGADSRALIQVSDGKGPLTPIDTFRIIMMKDDMDRLYDRTNRMSNWLNGFTLVHNQNSYYDITLRQIGSRWIRPNSGYKIRFDPADPFYGVHDSIRLDLNGMAEIVMKQMVSRAGGGKFSAYDDIGYLVVPFHEAQTTRDDQPHHTHEVLVNLARIENTYLAEQFADGTSGTKWELDDVVYPSSPVDRDPEGLKQDTVVIQTADIGVSGDVATIQGLDPEFYRAHLLIKNNRVDDRFDVIKDFAQAIHTTGDALFDAANEVMDVDLWMRHYANQSYLGNWDTYGFRRPKNLRIYQRPEDGKIIPFFWDCDLCNFSERLLNAAEPTSRLDEIREFPHNMRLFWGHMHDYINRSFNEEYVSRWAAHYGELASFKTYGGDENFQGIAESTRRRSETALETIREEIPEVEFQITTPDGHVVNADESSVTLEGKGWVNVREIRLAESGIKLDAFWPETDSWQIELPLSPGENQITLEAYDFQQNLIATKSVNVTSTSENPAVDSLRISEVHYNPGPATEAEQDAGYGNDDFEFVELVNIGSEPISLAGVQLTRVNVDGNGRGLDFDFSDSAVTTLEAGQHAIVVEDLEAFAFRYGDVPNVAGQWAGNLSNRSETITLTFGSTLIQQFVYSDEWHPSTDGEGSSLVIVDVLGATSLWSEQAGWRPSGINGGSPGQDLGVPGDSNDDGIFNSSDLTFVFQAGEFEDDIDGNSTFAEGDWNGDGDFTTADFVLAFQFGNYSPAAVNSPLISDLVALDQLFSEQADEDWKFGIR